MRIGEIAALRKEDIDFDNKIIHVNRTLVYQKYEGDDKKVFHFELPKTKTSLRAIPMNKQCEIYLKTVHAKILLKTKHRLKRKLRNSLKIYCLQQNIIRQLIHRLYVTQ